MYIINEHHGRRFDLVEQIVETVLREARSGQHGDGKIYIMDVVEGARISTRERGADIT